MARGAVRQRAVGITPVAFLDDDQRKWGRVHAGVTVRGGLESLRAVAQASGATHVLITMPTAPGARISAVADAAIDAGLAVRTVPSLDEMVSGSFDPENIRPLRMEDLLRRPPVEPTVLAELASDIGGERILVTGAAGSIGSELARQLAALKPQALMLIDRAEGPLYELQREIETRHRSGDLPVSEVEFRLLDITNVRAVNDLIQSMRPTVVFHAAAYKHVPVMESHADCAVEVNVGGTLNLLRAADAGDVDRFILVSTDKAVDPTSVMGATKRMAELMVSEFGARNGRRWASVRFGNVLGSSGSVIPIFQKQLENGEPLTLTHEDMTRFFMTIPEAVHLILQAATLAQPAAIFVSIWGSRCESWIWRDSCSGCAGCQIAAISS
jgi:FlaA1/EpsC-like NDP-sugar epimerase